MSIRIRGYENIFIRIGQDFGYTALFMLEASTNEFWYCDEISQKWKMIEKIIFNEFYVPLRLEEMIDNSNLSGSHFSIFNDERGCIITNIGSKYGLFIELN